MGIHKMSRVDPEGIYRLEGPRWEKLNWREVKEQCSTKLQKSLEGTQPVCDQPSGDDNVVGSQPPPPAQQPKRKLLDLYNTNPMLHPGHTVCDLCRRQIAVVKYAAHLEKCLAAKGSNFVSPKQGSGRVSPPPAKKIVTGGALKINIKKV